ncbi:S8 family anti-phage peptidase IteS [Aeromonas veronii]
MAKKSVPRPREGLKAKTENPFIHVPFSRQDLGSIDRNGGGGGKILVEVDDNYRRNLAKSLDATVRRLSDEQEKFPGFQSTIIFKLRDIGVAKSHRPITVAAESGLASVGHAAINEMLVAGGKESIEKLKNVILKRNTKAVQANLSAIEIIEPWTSEKRNPEGIDYLLERGRAIIRLFQYHQHDFNVHNYEGVISLFHYLGLKGSELPRPRGLPLFSIDKLDLLDEEKLGLLLSYPGMRQIFAEPIFKSSMIIPDHLNANVKSTSSIPSLSVTPTVAVFDTGVSPKASAISDWIISNDTYILPPDTDYVHGTAVASLVSGGAHFNQGNSWLPSTPCTVHDVIALEANGSSMSDLELRLRDAVKKRPEIKVWNLSLGAEACSNTEFSDFSMLLDELSDEYGVLFVVAAGNYTDSPRRSWPNPSIQADRVSSPGESVRSLTVASITHADGSGALSSVGEPAPYSRRGPGPVFTPKPDICHVGGGVHAPWIVGSSSLNVLTPNNQLVGNFGTSFAAPVASSMAAHAWQALSEHPELTPSPSLIKALMIHSAQLSSPDYTSFERRYFGSGRPDDIMGVLFDGDDSFTLVFEANLIPGMRWRKSNYPIPSSLINNGKFRGEIIITATYAPPLDPSAGSEYVRANVELSFGVLDGDNIKGRVPMEGEDGESGYEIAQIEHGGKWSPVKIHRKSFPRGCEGENWALQAGLTLRAFEPPLNSALPVSIIVTLRSLDGDASVHAEGLRALALNNWVHTQLPVRIPIIV